MSLGNYNPSPHFKINDFGRSKSFLERIGANKAEYTTLPPKYAGYYMRTKLMRLTYVDIFSHPAFQSQGLAPRDSHTRPFSRFMVFGITYSEESKVVNSVTWYYTEDSFTHLEIKDNKVDRGIVLYERVKDTKESFFELLRFILNLFFPPLGIINGTMKYRLNNPRRSSWLWSNKTEWNRYSTIIVEERERLRKENEKLWSEGI